MATVRFSLVDDDDDDATSSGFRNFVMSSQTCHYWRGDRFEYGSTSDDAWRIVILFNSLTIIFFMLYIIPIVFPKKLNAVTNHHRRSSSRSASSSDVAAAYERNTANITSLLDILSDASTDIVNKKKTMQYPMLTPEHIEMLAARKWKSVLAWIAFHPDELLYVDKRSQTALHLAILFRAPAQVVDLMLYYGGCELATKQNEDDEIPLHWAVRLSAPKEVLGLLLSACPSSGFTVKDKDRNTPFSLVWDRHQEDLLNAWWHGGYDKVSTLRAWEYIMFFFRNYHEGKRTTIEQREDETEGASATTSHGSASSSVFRPLHVASECACPPGFFPFILRMYANQNIHERDEHGRVPLAIACSDPISNRSYDVQTKIQYLLSEYPDAAHIPDQHNRLPIYVALASGITWDEGISALLSQSPKCISSPDPITGLYAFMLAANGAQYRLHRTEQGTTNRIRHRVNDDLPIDLSRQRRRNATRRSDQQSNVNNEAKEEEARCLTTIYRILRADTGLCVVPQ